MSTLSQQERIPVSDQAPVRRRTIYGARWLGQIAKYLILLALTLLTIFPLVWMILTSFKPQREVFSTLFPTTIDLSGYVRMWTAADFPVHFLNSIYVTTLTVAIVVATATLAGYAFARFEFPFRDPIFYIFLGSMMIPPQVILIPMFIFLKRLDLLNSLTGLSFSYLGGALPFSIFLMRAFFKTMPGELEGAAKIDGCTDMGVFWHIYLPLARPGLATITIFQFMGTWNEFMFATTFISKPILKPLQPALYQAIGRYSTDWPALSAGMALAITPIIIVYLVLQRQFIRGLTAGAIKG